MSYSSLRFLGFVILAVCAYRLCPKERRYLVLLTFSAVFIGLAGGLGSLCFIYLSAAAVYLAALLMGREGFERRKPLFVCAVALIALLLCAYRFCDIELRVAAKLFGLGPEQVEGWRYPIVVPIGLSFYSLQLIAYLADVYKRRIRPERGFLRFLLFVSWFPHILQGPIARYEQLSQSLFAGSPLTVERGKSGALLVLWGLVKKLIIADRAKVIVDTVFAGYAQLGGAEVVYAAVLYAFQLYADFSGCVDISRGVSEVFGVDLARNFAQPYLAQSVKDFWKRWHITLSSWLRDHIYIPLGGNRKGTARKYVNLMLTFAVSGIWHGTGLNFLFWGLLHGAYQVLGDMTAGPREKLGAALKIKRDGGLALFLRRVFCFILVDLAWLFFRAPGLSSGLRMLGVAVTRFSAGAILDGSLLSLGLDGAESLLLLVSLLALLAVDLLHEKGVSLRARLSRRSLPVQWAVLLALIFAVMILGKYGYGYNAADFIYMQF